MAQASPSEDRKFVVALARGLDVLKAFKLRDGVLGNQEIAARTGLPKPTVSRLTYTLTRLGYLTHVERLGKYQLAPAALSLGYTALANLGIREIARPYMQELADRTGAAVSLGGRDGLRMIYVAHCQSGSAITVRLDVGSRIPMPTTAMGRAFLAALPASERAELLPRLAERAGEDWPRVKAGIDQALEDYATLGFTLSVGDWQPDVHAVGVPLAAADGSGVFAFNCGAPAFRFTRAELETDLGPRLVALVRAVDGALSGSEGTVARGRDSRAKGTGARPARPARA